MLLTWLLWIPKIIFGGILWLLGQWINGINLDSLTGATKTIVFTGIVMLSLILLATLIKNMMGIALIVAAYCLFGWMLPILQFILDFLFTAWVVVKIVQEVKCRLKKRKNLQKAGNLQKF